MIRKNLDCTICSPPTKMQLRKCGDVPALAFVCTRCGHWIYQDSADDDRDFARDQSMEI